jgi:hypothetical protein
MQKLSELGYKPGMEIELDEDLGNKIFLFYLKDYKYTDAFSWAQAIFKQMTRNKNR